MQTMTRIELAAADDVDTFWHHAAALAASGVPHEALVVDIAGGTADLFGGTPATAPSSSPQTAYGISTVLRALGTTALLHTDPQRFRLFYRLMRRLEAEPYLLSIASDPDVARAAALHKAVRRDMHKMTAFVRFREIVAPDGQPAFIAWFEPEHHIVAAIAPFFVRRFANMRWSILTPRRSIHWDGETLVVAAGATRRDAPTGDPVEDVWRTYYANIFNPARLKVQAMQTEMPKKYWHNLPESDLIAPLIKSARSRTAAMIAAPASIPAKPIQRPPAISAPPLTMATVIAPGPDAVTLESLADEEASCRRCPLFQPATQVVPGNGAPDARLMFVGEQPGDQEDIAGVPFVGPAGNVFNIALERVGIDRTQCFVTNAVKHFKFEPRGKRRLHKKPNTSEIDHCRWWLDIERKLVKPQLIVALGVTAARGILGKTVTISSMRGQIQPLNDREHVLVTVHPSYLLRLTDEADKRREWNAFLADLATAKDWLADHPRL